MTGNSRPSLYARYGGFFSKESAMQQAKLSPQQAIFQHCKGCTYDPHEKGTWVEQVDACTITQCELYEHRKKTLKTRRFEKEKELALLTPAQREIVQTRSIEFSKRMLDSRSRG
jgi:hypothetical protein